MALVAKLDKIQLAKTRKECCNMHVSIICNHSTNFEPFPSIMYKTYIQLKFPFSKRKDFLTV